MFVNVASPKYFSRKCLKKINLVSMLWMNSRAQIHLGLSKRFWIIRFKKVIYKQKNDFALIPEPQNVQKSTSWPNFGTCSIPFWIILTRAFIWNHHFFPGGRNSRIIGKNKIAKFQIWGPNINIIILLGALRIRVLRIRVKKSYSVARGNRFPQIRQMVPQVCFEHFWTK